VSGLTLDGGTIAVTGAGSGIGAGIARAAAARGMRVVVSDVAADRAEAVAAELRDGGADAVAVVADVGEAAAVERLADVACERGDLRVAVNNAGVEATGRVWEVPPEATERLIRVNLLGAFNGVRAFVGRMVAAGEPAAVVNVASMAALISGPVSQAAYNASKHGVQALTESLALELAEAGAPIAVHVVNPGPVATRIFTDAPTAGERGAGARDDYHAMVTEQGISGDEAGAIVVAGVERGGFWIETHPEMRAAASAQRARMLTGALPPAPPDLG